MPKRNHSNRTYTNQETVRKLYTKYRVQLIHWIIKYFNLSIEEATELGQEAFAIFIEKMVNGSLPEFNKESNSKTYLFAIAKNKAHERLRERNKAVSLSPQHDREFTTEIEEKERQEVKIEKAAIAFKKLGQKCQKLLQLAIVLKVPMKEIAVQLGYENAATAKNLKYKCLVQLRKVYQTT